MTRSRRVGWTRWRAFIAGLVTSMAMAAIVVTSQEDSTQGAWRVADISIMPVPHGPPNSDLPSGRWEPPSNSFILRDVRAFDGEAFHENTDVLVVNGLIEHLGALTPHEKHIPAYVMTGHTVLPAFIDAHTHNSFPNSTNARSDALRFGVGTHLDMLGDPSLIAPARADRNDTGRTDQADMWSAGRLVHIGSLNEGEIEEFVAARIDEGSDFIKITIYSGEVFKRHVATLNHEQLVRIVAAAHAHGKMAVAHALTLSEAQLAISAGVDGIVHLFGNERITPEMLTALRRNGQFLISTMSYLEGLHSGEVPMQNDRRIVTRLSLHQRQSLLPRPPQQAYERHVVQRLPANLRALVEAGVPVLVGTDIPNPGTAAGATVHHELELFVAAGVPPLHALRSATSLTADAFGLHDRGRIRKGLRADLILVEGNPLDDITATREIVAVWKNGFPVVARFGNVGG